MSDERSTSSSDEPIEDLDVDGREAEDVKGGGTGKAGTNKVSTNEIHFTHLQDKSSP